MKRIIIISLFLLFCSCTQEYVTCESGYGYLYKNDKEVVCPFYIQKKTVVSGGTGFVDIHGPTVLRADADDYFPLRLWNSPYMYRIKMNVLKKDFTEEQYTVNLWTADENFRACGESREFTFYKIAENADYAEYVSRTTIDSVRGQYLFFAEKEMPSYKWYHVLKICDKGHHLIGEIKE